MSTHAADVLIDLWEIRNMPAVRRAVKEYLATAGVETRGPRITIEELDDRLLRVDARTYTAIPGIFERSWSEGLLALVHNVDPGAGGRVEVFNLDRAPDVTVEAD